MNYHGITYPDVNNGSGCRVTLWVAGCPHHCLGCHNPETWDFQSGKSFNRPEVYLELRKILQLPYISGLTLSGGEPFAPDNIEEVIEIVGKLLKRGMGSKNIWAYTGYVFEDLLKDEDAYFLLQMIDVLVDGPYIQSLRDVSLPFRGSLNQRIIDVPASLEQGKTVLLDITNH